MQGMSPVPSPFLAGVQRMAFCKPLLPGAGALLATLGLAGLAYLVWGGLVAWDLGELAGQARVIQEEARRERNLEALHRTLFACLEDKDQVARELAAGRLSLVEAAARFRAIARETPGFDRAVFRRVHGGDSEEESYCWAVIQRVRDLLADHPAHAQEVAWRLEAELQELLHSRPPSFPL
jgi:hypothetical protein